MVTLVPVDFHLRVFEYLFQYNPFIFRAYFNSTLYTILNTAFTLVLCSLGGFVLAQSKLAFRGLWGTLLLVSMFFNGGLVPTFLWFRQLGLLDTIWAIVLPTAVSAFYVFLFRVYILSNVSTELLESVYVDWETVEVVAPTVDGEEVWKRQRSRLGGSRILSAVSEHAAAAVKVVDFLYTDAGATLTLMGPEGYAWVYDDTPGNLWQRRWILCWSGQYPVDECRENDPDKSKTRGEMIGENPLQFLYAPSDTWGMDWTSFYMDPADPTGLIALRGEVANIAARWIDEGTWHLPPAPQFPFTDDELDEKVQLEVQLHTYVDEQMTRFIDGQNDMSGDWEAFIDRIKQLGAGRLEEIYNTAMNRYLEAAGITLN